jgi:dihydrofolate reductase
MRKIVVQEFITLDGVMQAPGGPEEDPSENFEFGGWTAPYFRDADDAAGEFMQEWMKSTDILLGRKTYDLYVMSSNLTENKTDWKNVSFLSSVDDIKKLKDAEGSDIKVHGSGNLAQTLFKNDLVDELHLMTFPITIGGGKRLFGEGTIPVAFKLTNSLVAKNGVIFANYKRAGEVKTGTVGE